MEIQLKDQKKLEVDSGATVKDVALKLNLTDPDRAVAATVNGVLRDFDYSLEEGDQVIFIDFYESKGKEVFWHTSAHVLALAVKRLWPEAEPTIGPPIENGFYYDFGSLKISDEDFPKIEKEMQKIIEEGYLPQRVCFKDKQEALENFSGNKYKKELIESFDSNDSITGYWVGDFFDLCRGPHLPNLKKIKAIKVLKTAGAYWRGDVEREMLTRIYAISFPSKKGLSEYLHQLEEAKKRDHKILGPKLDLFSVKEEAPGMPFIHAGGMVIWKELLSYLRGILEKTGYVEIKTPTMMTRELWEKSGHWANYKANMFTSLVDEREFAIKPMNCPGGMLYYKTYQHSYRDFPLRVSEIGNVYRNEASGAVSGLFRVRSFHQDDAHLFIEPHQVKQEILIILQQAKEYYSTFGLPYHLELSTRPEEGTIGTDEEWEMATSALKDALETWGEPYQLNEGDGAFYGPKIDVHVKDAIGRTWQCGTIQLDLAIPRRFDLEYAASDGTRRCPVVIHRTILGSVERFFGVLIEHFAGAFPLWLSPKQVRIVAVSDKHNDWAYEINEQLKTVRFRTEVDDSNESVNKKIRNAQLAKVNYILVVGDREVENKTANVRTRDGKVHGEMSIQDFTQSIDKERVNRQLTSCFQKDRGENENNSSE